MLLFPSPRSPQPVLLTLKNVVVVFHCTLFGRFILPLFLESVNENLPSYLLRNLYRPGISIAVVILFLNLCARLIPNVRLYAVELRVLHFGNRWELLLLAKKRTATAYWCVAPICLTLILNSTTID